MPQRRHPGHRREVAVGLAEAMKSEQEWGIKYCPHCGRSFDHPLSLVNGFWTATTDVYFCWCYHCHWRGEITPVQRVETTEPAAAAGSRMMSAPAGPSGYLH